MSLKKKLVRNTISNRRKAKDQVPTKLVADIQNPNLQTVDMAVLPNDADTLCDRFTLKVREGVGILSVG